MKSENKSWKEIALQVGASKKDVQNRYKDLMKSSFKFGDGEKKDGNTSNGWETVFENTDVGNGNMPDFSALFEDEEKNDEGEKKEEEKNGWGANNNSGNSWENSGRGNGDGGKKQKVGSEKNNNKNKNETQQNGCNNNGRAGGNRGGHSVNNNRDCGNGGHRNQESGFSGYSNPFDDSHAIDEEEEPQKGKGRLKSDGVWTQDDCEVLEWLESKYEESKWLHLQAGFYNWTGRMVIAELIQKKFRGDGAA
jgi:hypothetical protein